MERTGSVQMIACHLTYPAWLEAFNHYSNLLLVVVTLAYVVLTWRSNRALRESQSRVARSHHLEDIKANVVTPLLNWLEEAISCLSAIGTRYLTDVQPISDSHNISIGYRLCPRRIQVENLSGELLDDASEHHFPEELSQYKAFQQVLENLFDDIYEFSNECCEEIRRFVALPHLTSINRNGKFESIEELVHACLLPILAGVEPFFNLRGASPDAEKAVFIHTYPAAIAADSEENIKRWLPEAIQLIKDQWKAKKFPRRIADMKEDAASLRGAVQSVGFMQEIPGNCKYIGL
ncbi:MAG: hypothetical protein ACRD5R_16205 [Candidatus Acidiferrales bacterium]